MSWDETPSTIVKLENGNTYLPVKPNIANECYECCARNNALLCNQLAKVYNCIEHKVVFAPYKAPEKSVEVKQDKVNQPKHKHYFKDISKLDKLDVYRIIDLYEITDPCIQHALKKILVAGGRGHKDITTDIQNVIDTLERWKEMQNELST